MLGEVVAEMKREPTWAGQSRAFVFWQLRGPSGQRWICFSIHESDGVYDTEMVASDSSFMQNRVAMWLGSQQVPRVLFHAMNGIVMFVISLPFIIEYYGSRYAQQSWLIMLLSNTMPHITTNART